MDTTRYWRFPCKLPSTYIFSSKGNIYSGTDLKEIGEKFGIKESAVSQASRRLVQILERDKDLLKQIKEIRMKLNM